MIGWIIAAVVILSLVVLIANMKRVDRVPSEALYRSALAQYSLSETDETLLAAKAIALSGNKIEAIKRLREKSGMGLKEAKDVIDYFSYVPAKSTVN